ncbi:MAG: RluA family pseudouridine synthase, partial [Ktedonobacteraceae bacterium]|nr:RluA family pseudouridine synthase [Ktedonobacteraceae bacterium]
MTQALLRCHTGSMDTADIVLVYQDHHLLVVNKPAGVVIHPTYKHSDDTLWNALLAYLAQQGSDDWQPPALPDDPAWQQAPVHVRQMLRRLREERLWREEGLLPRPCLLHRLDKDTSGIVVLARTERARRHIVRQFEAHTVVKRYLAVVRAGAPEWTHPQAPLVVTQRYGNGSEIQLPVCNLIQLPAGTELVLDGPLGRDPADRRRCVVLPGGQQAVTVVRILATVNGYALLDVAPITGRTHQIRAHLAALG